MAQRGNAGGVKDSALEVRAVSTLTTTEAAVAVPALTGGISLQKPMALYVRFGTLPTGTSPTCLVSLNCISAGHLLDIVHVDTIDENTTYPFMLTIPFPPTALGASSWTVDFTTGGTSPVFTNVEAWVGLADNLKVDA